MRKKFKMKMIISSFISAVILLSACGIGHSGIGHSETAAPEIVIAPQYDLAGPFRDGLALVEMADGSGGFIDKSGTIVIPFKHEYTDSYNDYTWDFSEGMAKIFRKGKYGFIDTTGKVAVPMEYEESRDYFREGLAAVKKGGKWGYVDTSGREVIPPLFDEAGSFYEGLAWVGQNNKFGYIDRTGTVTIPIQYDVVSNFQDGMASVDKEGKTQLIDRSGNEVSLGADYDYVLGFSEGLGIVVNEEYGDDLYGIIDLSGKEIVQPKYDHILDFHEGKARVQLNGVWGFIDQTGQEIVKPQYYEASDFSEGLARVRKNTDFRFVDAAGNEILSLQYEFAGDFNDGLAPVQIGGKWGYIANPLEVLLANTPDDWAAEGIHQAIQAGLIPGDLQNGYRDAITRQAFCRLAIHFIEIRTGQTIDAYLASKGIPMPESPFIDTSDPGIIAAYSLGIVSGKGGGIFDPNGRITREEASVLLKNTANLLDQDQDSSFASPVHFADNDLISDWAMDAVGYVYSKEWMNGVGENRFDPKGSYTRQQAYLTILRMYYLQVN